MQTTAEGGDRTTLTLRPPGAPLTVERCHDPRGPHVSTFDRVLRGMVRVGLVQEAICRFLLLTIDTLGFHLVRLDLPTPSERAMRKPSGERPWTDDEVRVLIELWTANLRTAAIGERLGRSAGSVRSKARRLGLFRRRRRDLIKTITTTAHRDETTAPLVPVESLAEVVPDAPPGPPAPCPNTAISAVPVTAITESAAPISSEIIVAPASSVGTQAAAVSGIVFAASEAAPAADTASREGRTPEPSAGKATKRPQRRRIDWTDALCEEVARRWFAYQHHRGIAEDLGMTEAQVRSQANALGLPRRERKKIVPDYVKGRPYDTTLEKSMVKRRCMIDRRVFWGDRNGPHTSPRAMKTKRYRALRSGLEEAHSTVSVE
jgi:hypothetical protein